MPTRRTTYTIRLEYPDHYEWIPLAARTDKTAMRQTQEYLPREDRAKVFLHFHRNGTGSGYLDRDGNSCWPGREW